MYDFDTPPDRRHSDSIKWQRYAGRDVLPMWVADMDFAAAPPILEALKQRIDHGVFGYAEPWDSLIEAIVEGIAQDHSWRIDPSWLVWLPGMVTGFNLACMIAGEPGDSVLSLTPVYPPFLTAPGNTRRRLIRSDMIKQNLRWECNWDDIAARIEANTRLLMLCNPHNPVGRVFSRDELLRFGALAEKHDLVICSDEIHCGLVLDPAKPHIPIAALDESIAQRTITLMAPSKTWNVASLYCAFAIIPNAMLRNRYQHAMQGLIPRPNVLGMVATEAAYRNGKAWRSVLLDYLRSNAQRVQEAIAAIPGLSTTPVEATYLSWIDCRELELSNPASHFEAHGVGLSDGRDFGAPGFVRLNFGCSRGLLDEGLRRVALAVK
ncbi:MAG TPA: PatB family C-S lyase [Rhodocyclaceae bacterium]|nr:PatB family C-S lyase [Rhodocyclaceae bacterium]